VGHQRRRRVRRRDGTDPTLSWAQLLRRSAITGRTAPDPRELFTLRTTDSAAHTRSRTTPWTSWSPPRLHIAHIVSQTPNPFMSRSTRSDVQLLRADRPDDRSPDSLNLADHQRAPISLPGQSPVGLPRAGNQLSPPIRLSGFAKREHARGQLSALRRCIPGLGRFGNDGVRCLDVLLAPWTAPADQPGQRPRPVAPSRRHWSSPRRGTTTGGLASGIARMPSKSPATAVPFTLGTRSRDGPFAVYRPRRTLV